MPPNLTLCDPYCCTKSSNLGRSHIDHRSGKTNSNNGIRPQSKGIHSHSMKRFFAGLSHQLGVTNDLSSNYIF